MEEESVISFSDQSSYCLADELLSRILNGGSLSDYVLFSEFRSAAKTDIEYHTRKKIINSLLYDYELISIDNHEVELTRRGVEVAKLGIENYNRKIEEEIRAKKRKEKIKEIIDVASKFVGTVIAILSVYLACRPK